MDLEDFNYLSKVYRLSMETDLSKFPNLDSSKISSLTEKMRWIDHPVTLIADPSECKFYLNPRGKLIQSGNSNGIGFHTSKSTNRMSHHRKPNAGNNNPKSGLSNWKLNRYGSKCLSPEVSSDSSTSTDMTSCPSTEHDFNADLIDRQIFAVSNFCLHRLEKAGGESSVFDSVDIHLGPASSFPPVHSTGKFLYLCIENKFV